MGRMRSSQRTNMRASRASFASSSSFAPDLSLGNDSVAVKKGILNKKGKVNKAFLERWCELRGQQVDYFKKQGHRKSKGSIVFGASAEVSMVEPNEENKLPPHCFCIQTSERAYILQAESDAAARAWLEAIITQRDMVGEQDLGDAAAAGSGAQDGGLALPEEDFGGEPERELRQGWDPALSIVQELGAVRRDRRQLLQYVLWQKQQLDMISGHAEKLEPESEDAMQHQYGIMELCGRGSVQLPPGGAGVGDWRSVGVQLDLDAIAVPALLDNLADVKGPRSDLSGSEFAKQELRWVGGPWAGWKGRAHVWGALGRCSGSVCVRACLCVWYGCSLEDTKRLPTVYYQPGTYSTGSEGTAGTIEGQPAEEGAPDHMVPLNRVPEFRRAFRDEEMLLAGAAAVNPPPPPPPPPPSAPPRAL
eukprot:COSAG01_NODE_3519_length_5979_cov_340.102551_1_plen_419_part_00